MFRKNIIYNNIATGHSSSNHISTSFDTVRNNSVICTVKFFYTFNANHISTCTTNLSTHFIQIAGKSNDFRFFSCVFQNGNAFSQSCSHHYVFSSTYAREVKINGSTFQAIRSSSFDETILLIKYNT